MVAPDGGCVGTGTPRPGRPRGWYSGESRRARSPCGESTTDLWRIPMVRTPRRPGPPWVRGGRRTRRAACHDRRVMDRRPGRDRPLPLAATATRPPAGSPAGRPAPDESARANRRWWDAAAPAYLAEHGARPRRRRLPLVPGGAAGGRRPPARRRRRPAGAGDRLRLGARARAGCAAQGADVVALDLSAGMLGPGRRAQPGDRLDVPLLQADAGALPLADAGRSTSRARPSAGCRSSPTSRAVLAEVARVLRPGGRFVASVNHPMRWPFPDSPDPEDLRVVSSYFDRRPYVETDDDGRDGLRRAPPHGRRLGAGGRRRRPRARGPASSRSGRRAARRTGASGRRSAAPSSPARSSWSAATG